jgi:hypothetical protein
MIAKSWYWPGQYYLLKGSLTLRGYSRGPQGTGFWRAAKSGINLTNYVQIELAIALCDRMITVCR